MYTKDFLREPGAGSIVANSQRLEQTHQATKYDDLLAIFTSDGPLYGAIHGPLMGTGKAEWRTLKDPNSDQLWKLSGKKLREFYEDPYYFVGKRFNSLTSYLMLDVDACSPYHPEMGDRFGDLLASLEELGLVRPVIIRSSDNGGLHVYFPLNQQVKTWSSAKKLEDHLTRQGFVIKGGTLELFPNAKADRDSLYNGHRLPLQAGSFLLNPHSLEIISGDPADFLAQWRVASAGNELATPQPVTRDAPATQPASPGQLPPIAWKESHQSNDVLKRLANWGYEKLGLATVTKLGEWMRAIAPRLPGYEQFTSDATKRDIARNWCFRWARSRIRRGGAAVASAADLNQQRKEDCTERLLSILKEITDRVWESGNQLFEQVCKLMKCRFGKGINKQKFLDRKGLWQAFLKSHHHVGGDEFLREHSSFINQEDLKDRNGNTAVPTVDNREPCEPAQPVEVSAVHTPPDPPPKPAPPIPSEAPQKVGRVSKAQLQGLPDPEAIRATGEELKAAGIEGYDTRHDWTIYRGEYSCDLWNRLRFVAFGGAV